VRRLLVLWDVDHTLVELHRLHYELYGEAFEAMTGRAPERLVGMAGRTDRDGMTEMLSLHGMAATEEQLGVFAEALVAAFRRRAGTVATLGHPVAGAEAVLSVLHATPGVVQTLLTGNLRALAVAKLGAFGLDRFIDFEVGAFGWDHAERGPMVGIARERAARTYGVAFDAASTVLLGDTPRDMEAARVGGAVAIGVAAGASSPAGLREAGAVAVFEDLSDTAAVVGAILGAGTDARAPGRRPGSGDRVVGWLEA